MAQTPLFSVITVTRDNLAGLRRTCASLIAQTCKDYEWIVIDGASQDGTKAFLQTTATQWQSETDSGIYDAMNKGLSRAQGQYILFLNAGDELAARETLALVKENTKESPALIYGDSLENGFYKPARPSAEIEKGLFTHHQAIFYNRAALGILRYDLAYKIAADYDLTARLLRQNPDALHIPAPLCIFESGGVSQQKATLGRREQFKIRRALGLCPPFKNAAIYAAQTLIWTLRQTAPRLYWHLKSSGNRPRGSARNQTPPPRQETLS